MMMPALCVRRLFQKGEQPKHSSLGCDKGAGSSLAEWRPQPMLGKHAIVWNCVDPVTSSSCLTKL